jgi:peptidyl-prolyl cis-trans isomerase C
MLSRTLASAALLALAAGAVAPAARAASTDGASAQAGQSQASSQSQPASQSQSSSADQASSANGAESGKTAKDPVVAKVDGYKIHLSDVAQAAQSLPAQLRQAPPQEVYPVLLNRLIDERALLVEAQKTDLAKQPDVKAEMQDAADQALESAYLRKQVEPKITKQAMQAYYKSHYENAKQPEQVKARQILVKSKDEAEKIIKQLENGAKFSALAKQDSIDPGAKDGGELGWFTKDEMVKPFAEAAFALKPGTFTKQPVKTQFGWHVIESQGKRKKPVPSYDDVKHQIRQHLTRQAVTDALETARKSVKVEMFNPDGTPLANAQGAAAPGAKPAIKMPPATSKEAPKN